jgi:Domain of unknown function (DUF6378)
MDAADILARGHTILAERGQEYGPIRESFQRAAVVASALTGKSFTPKDVAAVLVGVKQSRLSQNPGHPDSNIDLVNYTAILAQFNLEGVP